jgi:CheY-like chemotaxis protein
MELADFILGILSEQYEVRHALNGALGMEQTLSGMPDVVISDVMMPVMNGFEFCRRVKDDIRTSHIPVILLTAKASQEDVITGLTQGANDYLAKPFHPTELLLRVHNLLDTQEKGRNRMRLELSRPDPIPFETAPPVQDIFLTRLYEFVDERLDDPDFGVDQVLELVNMSRSSLHRKLKSITGLSTTEVIRNYRLSKAAGFLREGFNSSDTAYKSGFGSPAYFTKCFREVYGLTPGDFIRQSKS